MSLTCNIQSTLHVASTHNGATLIMHTNTLLPSPGFLWLDSESPVSPAFCSNTFLSLSCCCYKQHVRK